jgi:hypothetical protein
MASPPDLHPLPYVPGVRPVPASGVPWLPYREPASPTVFPGPGGSRVPVPGGGPGKGEVPCSVPVSPAVSGPEAPVLPGEGEPGPVEKFQRVFFRVPDLLPESVGLPVLVQVCFQVRSVVWIQEPKLLSPPAGPAPASVPGPADPFFGPGASPGQLSGQRLRALIREELWPVVRLTVVREPFEPVPLPETSPD